MSFCFFHPFVNLYIRRLRKSLRQDSERRTVVLYEKIRIGGKNMRLVQDMYEGSKTVVMFAVETAESFKVKIALYQRSALSPFLFPVIVDSQTDEVRENGATAVDQNDI